MSATLSNTNLANDSQSMISAVATVNADIATITNQIDALSNLLLKAQADGYTGDYAGVLASIAMMKVSINQIGAAVAAFAAASASSAGTMTSVQIQATLSSASAAINDASSQVETIRTNLVNNLIPQLNQVCGSLSNMLSNVTDIMNSLSDTLGSMDIIFSSIDSTIEETGSSLSQVAASIDEIIAKIDNVISWMDGLDEDEKLDMVTSFLGGDAESYGKFFSEPVTVNTQAIYPVESYGCAVTPFYTILALWVGGTLLVSLIKVKAEGENLKDVTHAQLFFGRYLLFFFLGQLQAAIIVIGDIYLLHCQVLYHGMFFVVAALSSFTFTLLIYSLTISFGDIGKALAVIFMVLQIAGSSGTFPIELLPEFYQKVYIFFPFPYAINAMRETVAGLYGMTYAENLVKLMLFAVAALVIGLVIRIPFIKVNHYMEKRMEDTKMM